MTKSFLHHLVPSKNWYIKENGIDKSAQGVRESQFTLGNGLICSRGVLEELPFDSHPGTFISGVFDRVGSKVSDIANLPNPFNLKILIGGEKLDPTVMPTTKGCGAST